jgi:predicted nucleic acid-binding protein
VTLALCFKDEATAEIDRCLRRVLAGQAVAPTLWALETANVVNLAARRGRIQPADQRAFLDLFQMLPIHLVATDQASALGRIANLGHEYTLTTYDAAYLAAAVTFGLPLATRDKALVQAAEAAGAELVL